MRAVRRYTPNGCFQSPRWRRTHACRTRPSSSGMAPTGKIGRSVRCFSRECDRAATGRRRCPARRACRQRSTVTCSEPSMPQTGCPLRLDDDYRHAIRQTCGVVNVLYKLGLVVIGIVAAIVAVLEVGAIFLFVLYPRWESLIVAAAALGIGFLLVSVFRSAVARW